MCVWIISRLTANLTLATFVEPVFQYSTTFDFLDHIFSSFVYIEKIIYMDDLRKLKEIESQAHRLCW